MTEKKINDEIAWKTATIIHHAPTGLNDKSFSSLAKVVAHILADDVVGKRLVAEYKKEKLI